MPHLRHRRLEARVRLHRALVKTHLIHRPRAPIVAERRRRHPSAAHPPAASRCNPPRTPCWSPPPPAPQPRPLVRRRRQLGPVHQLQLAARRPPTGAALHAPLPPAPAPPLAPAPARPRAAARPAGPSARRPTDATAAPAGPRLPRRAALPRGASLPRRAARAALARSARAPRGPGLARRTSGAGPGPGGGGGPHPSFHSPQRPRASSKKQGKLAQTHGKRERVSSAPACASLPCFPPRPSPAAASSAPWPPHPWCRRWPGPRPTRPSPPICGCST